MNYPCPAIFLFEEIRADGSFFYKVVDGKQRLTTLFDFVSDKIAISDDHPSTSLRGQSFSVLPDELKLSIWRYQFSVEFVEQENESLINDIFNRINKNVAKLSQQELRHALFNGHFITSSEQLTEYMDEVLPERFPNIAPQSRRQMKDVENVSTMLLFVENGERSLSQADLDRAYKDIEEDWADRVDTCRQFRKAIEAISAILNQPQGDTISSSRLKNQADFYSLFAAIVELHRGDQMPSPDLAAQRLKEWLDAIDGFDPDKPSKDTEHIADYLEAARAASNDSGPRRTRINGMKKVLEPGYVDA